MKTEIEKRVDDLEKNLTQKIENINGLLSTLTEGLYDGLVAVEKKINIEKQNNDNLINSVNSLKDNIEKSIQNLQNLTF